MMVSNGPVLDPRTTMYISPGEGSVLNGLHHESTLPSAVIALGMRISTVRTTMATVTKTINENNQIISVSPRHVGAKKKCNVTNCSARYYTISIYKMQDRIILIS